MTKKNVKGITLIALVITIIILLILAGVTIATLTGENGLLTKAGTAVDATKIADYTERINLIVAEEIAKRLEKPKEELLIKSLKDKINEQDWIQDVFMTDDSGVEKTEPEEGTHLIVETKDGYELVVEVDNVGLVAKVVESGKASKEKYEVTYIEDGKKEKIEVRKGFSITLKECDTIKQGYKFTGWCEKENGEGERFANGSLYKPTQNTKLYAIFEEKTATISFNANGGEGQLEDIIVKQGQATQLPNNETITRQGYKFKGWNTKQDESGTFYNNNANITITENITLYAVWEENIVATLTITNKKFTEGTTINLGGIAANKIQKIELKVGGIILYSENKIENATYSKNNIQLTGLNNLDQLPFYNDMEVTLEVTTEVGTKGNAKLTKVKNYTVSTAEQLRSFATVVNNGNVLEGETIIQLDNIDLHGSKDNQWTPIIGFRGIFTGNNKIINNVYIISEKNEIGFFRSIEGASSIKKVQLENVTISGKINTGGIVAFANSTGTIEECIIKSGTIEGQDNTGGIVGQATNNSSKISGCKVYANVTGGLSTGGIVGNNNRPIEYCAMYGNTTSNVSANTVSLIGGITGDLHNNYIFSCVNKGSVIGQSYVGGITGDIRAGAYVNYCYNIANVSRSFCLWWNCRTIIW